jgi:hypothetical protein
MLSCGTISNRLKYSVSCIIRDVYPEGVSAQVDLIGGYPEGVSDQVNLISCNLLRLDVAHEL